jgi:hypothetical protein
VVKKSILVPTGGCMEDEPEDPDGCCKDRKSLVKLEKGHKAEASAWHAACFAPAHVPAPVLLFGDGGSLFHKSPAAQSSPAIAGFGGLPPPVPLYIFFSCLKLAGCQGMHGLLPFSYLTLINFRHDTQKHSFHFLYSDGVFRAGADRIY